MPNCTVEFPSEPITLGQLGRRVIEAAFDGGDLISDAGVLVLKRAAAAAFADERRAASATHAVRDLLAQ